MKAKQENIINKNRVKLEEVLPLEFPYSLEIAPSNLCNFRCKFCAIHYSKETLSFKKELMTLDLFKKIIDDLVACKKKLKVLRLGGQGEPLLNPALVEMIRYAKENEVAEYMEIVTNGSKFNPIFNQALVNSGLDRIRISIEAVDQQGYLEMSGVKINFDDFVKNIKDLYDRSTDKCEIYIKTVDAAVNSEQKKKLFYDIFGEICDRIFIDSVIPLWSDFEEINQNFNIGSRGLHGQALRKVEVCPFPFRGLMINSNGDVTACCADWKRKLILGNLREESFQAVWNGELLRSFWKNMLRKQKDQYEMCAKCVLPNFDCTDNIDDYAELILKRLL